MFATTPQSKDVDRSHYEKRVANVSRWSEAAGCAGILVYSDNGLTDPWLTAGAVLRATDRLCPLIAVQPVYMHPYTAAKMVATYGYLYGRRICLNMIAGGFLGDLEALDDVTPHDDRYVRLGEYTEIIKELLRRSSTGEELTFEGKYYTVKKLKLTPALDPDLMPRILLSGSSEAGLATAKRLGAVAVQYPKPAGAYSAEMLGEGDFGIRVGIIVRATAQEAWKVAHERFPPDRKGEIAHMLAMKKSDSVWHKSLSEQAERDATPDHPYWLEPFKNYKTFCPYLVGDYETVSAELTRYVEVGYGTFILDIPANELELGHIGTVFQGARKLVA